MSWRLPGSSGCSERVSTGAATRPPGSSNYNLVIGLGCLAIHTTRLRRTWDRPESPDCRDDSLLGGCLVGGVGVGEGGFGPDGVLVAGAGGWVRRVRGRPVSGLRPEDGCDLEGESGHDQGCADVVEVMPGVSVHLPVVRWLVRAPGVNASVDWYYAGHGQDGG